MRNLKQAILTIGIAACLTFPVFAADQVVLRDGRVVTGEILEQTEHYVKIRVTLGTASNIEVLFMGDVVEIKRDAAKGTEQAGSGETANTEAAPRAASGVTIETGKAQRSPNNPGVLVLPLTGMVGVEFRAAEIRKVAEEADLIRDLTGLAPVIVLQIESGGGLMFEMYELQKAVAEVRQRHRVVAWIKEAISAACATALHCHEIYFMTEGNAGAMTGYAGETALSGEAKRQWLQDAGDWAEATGRSKYVAWAMIGNEFELSYDKNDETGEVKWYGDLSGKHILSRKGQNLSFTKTTAVHSGFADGWADTPEELAKAMQLQEWYEVSEVGRRLHRDWTNLLDRARYEIPRTIGSIQVIQSSNMGEAERIGRLIQEYTKLRNWWDRVPELLTYEIGGVPSKEQIDRIIRSLQERLAEIRRRERETIRRRGGG